MHGLLVRPHESPNALQASDGTVFNAPVSFTDLYQKYGDSWRVSPADSLLNDCGAATQQGNPTKAVTVRDLPPDKAERARALCNVGVARGPKMAELGLSDVERGMLVAWAGRRKTAQATALRARIVLAAADGLTKWRGRGAVWGEHRHGA